MIEDFVIKEPTMFSITSFISGARELDYEKILALSDEDFAKFYFEKMSEYKNKDRWWGRGKIPHCSKCHGEISSPKELRRYYGRSLHPNCFREVYEKEGDETGLRKEYWDRVAKL